MTASSGPLLALLVLTTVAAYPSDRSHAFSLCKTPAKKNECVYGTERDFCKNIVCAKGPGERCGGPSNIHGRCGEGMHCRCEVCTGCSIHTLDCYSGSSVCH